MVFGGILQRFVDERPIAVMVRVVLMNQFSAERIDEIFAETAQTQYTRGLCFSTVTAMLSEVTLEGQRSIHAVFKRRREQLPTTIVSVYGKLKRAEPAVCEALVRKTADPLIEVLAHLRTLRRQPVSGYRLRIVDGNVLGGTDHRLKVLRDTGAAPLPGMTLAILDYASGMISRLIESEDGHANERQLFDRLLAEVVANDLLMSDANFATLDLLQGLADRKACFLIRHHGSLHLKPVTERRSVGKCSTGRVFEYEAQLSNGSTCRVIEILRNKPLKKGGRKVRLLTNVPKSKAAKTLAELYLKRWTIEEAFRQLTQDLSCEVKTLGYPRAALLAFSLAVMAYNCLACVRGALASTQGREKVDDELSHYYLALEVQTASDGLNVAVPPTEWAPLENLAPKRLAAVLKSIARHVTWDRYTKAPRGPKKPIVRKKVTRGAHVSTFSLLSPSTARA